MDEDKKELRDSGKRQEFGTGAVRDQAIGKGRFDLTCPHADFREARVFEKGSIKYGDRNWEKGIPVMRYLDSARRHIAQAMMGDQVEDHIAQARWNLSAYMETLYRMETGELPPELDNRPARMKPGFVPPYAKSKEIVTAYTDTDGEHRVCTKCQRWLDKGQTACSYCNPPGVAEVVALAGGSHFIPTGIGDRVGIWCACTDGKHNGIAVFIK